MIAASLFCLVLYYWAPYLLINPCTSHFIHFFVTLLLRSSLSYSLFSICLSGHSQPPMPKHFILKAVAEEITVKWCCHCDDNESNTTCFASWLISLFIEMYICQYFQAQCLFTAGESAKEASVDLSIWVISFFYHSRWVSQ